MPCIWFTSDDLSSLLVVSLQIYHLKKEAEEEPLAKKIKTCFTAKWHCDSIEVYSLCFVICSGYGQNVCFPC